MPSTLYLLAVFVMVLAAIPLCLWLLKRSPLGSGLASSQMRLVSILPLSPSQKVLTVEVGEGEDRRWLVLGVTPQGISRLHEMAPQDDAPAGGPAGGHADEGRSIESRPSRVTLIGAAIRQ